jgi:hypothetical protein
MSPTMGPIDDPRTTDGDPALAGQPELVRVGRRNGWRPAVLAVVVVAALLAAAVWKPWEPAPSVAGAGPSAGPAGAGGAPLPTITSGPSASGTPAPTAVPTPPTFAGLDLAIMGRFDPHAAWGVSVAYVSRTKFDDATRRGSPTVTPDVNWKSIEPGTLLPGPMLDHPDVTSVAFAATWPAGTRPLTIWVVSYGPPRPNPSTGPSRTTEPGQKVTLQRPIAAWLRVEAGQSAGSGLTSGAFFMPSPAPPGTAAEWPGHGWPAELYAFEIELEGGALVTLPFRIGGSSRS